MSEPVSLGLRFVFADGAPAILQEGDFFEVREENERGGRTEFYVGCNRPTGVGHLYIYVTPGGENKKLLEMDYGAQLGIRHRHQLEYLFCFMAGAVGLGIVRERQDRYVLRPLEPLVEPAPS